MRHLFTICLLVLSALLPVSAQERILRYDSLIEIQENADLEITETITVAAEGEAIQRGIFRDFPTRYTDKLGNSYRIEFQVHHVERDGEEEAWFTEELANGIRLNTGNDELLDVPATYTYTLYYTVTRQISYFDENDELYYNAIGNGWEFPIESARIEVRLPHEVSSEEMETHAYTGSYGSSGQNYRSQLTDTGAVFRLTEPLAPREGFTLSLTFPKGVVHEPSEAERAAYLINDNAPLHMAMHGFWMMLLFCGIRWLMIGRDPKPGTIITRYDPPSGFSPGELRGLVKMSSDSRGFTADILSLAVANTLRIEQHGKSKKEWRAIRTELPTDLLSSPTLTTLHNDLFSSGRDSIEFSQDNAGTVHPISHSHSQAISKRLIPEYYSANGGSTFIAFLFPIFTLFGVMTMDEEGGLLLALIINAFMFGVAMLFMKLIKRPSKKGRALLDEIEGFKRYLSVAEKQDLQQLKGPSIEEPRLSVARFESLLPYAVALNVEDAWSKKLAVAIGASAAAAAASSSSWYSGESFSDIGSFTHSLGTSFASQISASSSPPGSSSGSGGGGYSGGGGGGGGGGGR